MINAINGFICSDDDCMQHYKLVDPIERKYLFIQAIWIDICRVNNNGYEYIIVADYINVSEMSLNDIECAICGYYEDIKAMEESYDKPLGKLDEIVAECAFESNPFCSYEFQSELVTIERAEEIIQEFINTNGARFILE